MTFFYPFLFGISGGEILVLLLIVLLLFGPKKIPEIARMIGRGMNEVKKVQREINTEIHRYSSEIEKETKEMQSEINKMTKEPGINTKESAGTETNEIPAKPIENNKQQDQSGIIEHHKNKSTQVDNKPKSDKNDDKNDLPYPYGPGTDPQQ
jgi:TatA/E family protein of Tat protein translocase